MVASLIQEFGGHKNYYNPRKSDFPSVEISSKYNLNVKVKSDMTNSV